MVDGVPQPARGFLLPDKTPQSVALSRCAPLTYHLQIVGASLRAPRFVD
jgi:hypothetical protein